LRITAQVTFIEKKIQIFDKKAKIDPGGAV